MKQEQKLFEADYTKLNFRIGIDVCENGSILYVFDVKEGYTITYHTLIGVVETLKANFIQQQRSDNRKSETRITDLKEAQNSFEQALDKFNHPNDIPVHKSALSKRVKGAIAEYCIGGRYEENNKYVFSTRKFTDLMLSDLAKIGKWEYLRLRNFGEVSWIELNTYLQTLKLK